MARVRSFCCCVVLAACAQDTGARIAARVPAAGGEAAVREAVSAHAPALLIALDGASLELARRAAPGVRTVGIGDGLAAEPGRAALETVLVEDRGAPAAIELALLAAHRVALPPKVQLGVRTLTTANVAAGGALRPGPGDIGLVMLRQQHPAVLTTTPAVDVVFPIALLQVRGGGGPGESGERLKTDLVTAAKRYPQVALSCPEPARDAEGLVALAQRALADGARVLLVAAGEAPLEPVAAVATAADVAVVALDGDADAPGARCVVGQDPALLGRAAGDAARAALGGSGVVVVVHGDLAQRTAAVRLEAFEQAFAARAAK